MKMFYIFSNFNSSNPMQNGMLNGHTNFTTSDGHKFFPVIKIPRKNDAGIIAESLSKHNDFQAWCPYIVVKESKFRKSDVLLFDADIHGRSRSNPSISVASAMTREAETLFRDLVESKSSGSFVHVEKNSQRKNTIEGGIVIKDSPFAQVKVGDNTSKKWYRGGRFKIVIFASSASVIVAAVKAFGGYILKVAEGLTK